jgi:UDP-glucose:(heptosyl)LPS alpha-1,3-glucosyltransferase
MAIATRRLNIAVLHRTFRRDAGGAEAYAVAIALALAKTHDIHVFAQEMDKALEAVTYHPIPLFFKRPRWLNQLWFALATWWLTRHGFDIVHSHENTWHGQVQTVHVLPMRCKSIEDLPLLSRLNNRFKHLISPRLWTYSALEFFRFRLQPQRFWVAVSKPLQQRLLNMQPPLPQGQLLSISPGIYPRPSGQAIGAESVLQVSAKSAKVLLWVGNDAVKKNLDTVLAVLAKLDVEYSLLVVGKAAHTKPWKDKLVRLGITERVRHVGIVSDMEKVYASADILLHPTFEDTFGMVVLEAMSYGLPVVVSQAKYCGVAADLQNAVNAIILPDPLDANALTAAIVNLSEPSVYAQHQQAALAFSMQHLWSDAAKQYDVLFQKLTAQ